MQERPLTTINQAGEDSAPVFEVEEPTDGQVLAYDGDSGKWKNADAGGGSGGGVLVVNATVSENAITCDKTAGEMAAAYLSGGVVIVVPADGPGFNDNYYLVVWAEWSDDGDYSFHTFSGDEYSADTASDYPYYTLSN